LQKGPLIVFAVVMSAALLHANWNAIVKSAGDKFLITIMVTASASALSAALLPFLTAPHRFPDCRVLVTCGHWFSPELRGSDGDDPVPQGRLDRGWLPTARN
jgi:hypothetical protein